jgi:hypothetical protein
VRPFYPPPSPPFFHLIPVPFPRDVLHHPTAYQATPGGGTILEEEDEEEDEDNSGRVPHSQPFASSTSAPEGLPPSLKMSLSDSSLQQPSQNSAVATTLPNQASQEQAQTQEQESDSSTNSFSLPPSLASSLYSQSAGTVPETGTGVGTSPQSPTHLRQPSSPATSVSNRKLEQILFSESITSQEFGRGGGSTREGENSLYELSGSIESLDMMLPAKNKEKKVPIPFLFFLLCLLLMLTLLSSIEEER